MLGGDGVRLRPWQLSDVDELARACDDPVTARFLPHIPSPYTTESARWWITEGALAAWAAGGCAFAVTDPAGGVLGGAGISNLPAHRHHAEIGYWVAPWARGRGVATAALRVLSEWGFGNGIERMELLAAKDNVPSQRAALAAGFAREGVRRRASLGRDGVRVDLVAFVRMHDDPPGPIVRSLPDLPGGELTDGVVRLRPLTPDDVDDVFALFQFPEVAKSYYGPPMTREVAQRRCAMAMSSWLADERAELVIVDASTGAFAGDIGLQVREPFLKQAMIGYSLRPEFRGRGFATRAARLVTDWAFEIGIARVIAGTAPENEASQRVLQRAGFEREAYLKAALPGPDGKRVDDIQWVRISPTL
jgi:RimJ/RimL family protein N-acetyltransferase